MVGRRSARRPAGATADGPRSAGRRAAGRWPGSGRRVAALAVDWALCLAISTAFFDGDPMATLLVFAAENVLLVGTTGYTVGHRLLGSGSARTSAASGRWRRGDRPVRATCRPRRCCPGPCGPRCARSLLCLVIPAVVWDDHGRALHDRAAGTVVVRR